MTGTRTLCLMVTMEAVWWVAATRLVNGSLCGFWAIHSALDEGAEYVLPRRIVDGQGRPTIVYSNLPDETLEAWVRAYPDAELMIVQGVP